MATQAQPQQQPPAQPPSNVVTDTALAAVAASTLPASAAPVALTVTQIATMSTALLGALRKFQNQRENWFQDELTAAAHRAAPTLADVASELIGRELGYEQTFRGNQFDRIQSELQQALSLSDKDARDARVKQIFADEQRYTDLRETAMRDRVLSGLKHYSLEQRSPDGAFWELGEAKTHTVDCLAMAGKHWPWSVLHDFQPPLHPNCRCKLTATKDAIRRGLMTPDDVQDEADAYVAASAVQRMVQEAYAERLGAGRPGGVRLGTVRHGKAMSEARWDDRFPAGTANAGRFRPRVGGDPGAALLRRMRLLGRGQHHEPVNGSAGRWMRLGGTHVKVPHSEWRQTIGGVKYHSPEGSTNVYRDGELDNGAAIGHEGVLERIHDMAGQVRTASRSKVMSRKGAPLRKGDGPEAIMSMPARGYHMMGSQPAGKGMWSISYAHDTDADRVHAVISPKGVKAARWDPHPLDRQSAHASPGPPLNFAQHKRDMKAWAGEIADRYGASTRIRHIETDGNLEDHAGFHWRGRISLGPDTERDIDQVGMARQEGRELTDAERKGLYSAMRSSAHEMSHAVNPMSPHKYRGAAASLEEALAEENAHILAQKRLREQGQSDVLDWLRRNPTDIAAMGVYRKERGGLADILDRAGINDPTARTQLVQDLKFRIDPSKRFQVLGALLRSGDQSLSERDAEKQAQAMIAGSSTPRSVVQMSPSLPEKWSGAFKDIQAKIEKTILPVRDPTTISGPDDWTPSKQTIGGDVPEPKQQGLIPNFRHIPLVLGSKDFGTGAQKAKDADKNDWIVQHHDNDQDHVAQELLAGSVYHMLGVPNAEAGIVQTQPEPDFATVPDALKDEPELPHDGRLSAGVILRDKDGKLIIISPRNGYGGYKHTFSKGGVEKGSTTQQSALRELWEETGLHAHITGVVGDFKGTTGMTRFYEGVQTGGTPTVNDEVEAIHKVTPKIAAEMLNVDRDKKVLDAVLERPIPTGKFKDEFPAMKPGVALAYPVPKGKKITPKKPSEALARGYMADALVGNWDPVGSYGDNIRWDGDENPIRMNHGATFEFDRHGHSKPYGEVPVEAWTLLRRGQASGTMDINEDEMRHQASQVANEMTLDRINSLVDAAPFADDAARERIRTSLTGRVKWMRDFGDGLTDLPQPASGEAAAKALADGQNQTSFDLFPEEQEALDSFQGSMRDRIDAITRDNKKGDQDELDVIKRLDSAMEEAPGPADDVYAWVKLPEGALAKLKGTTIRQRSFTPMSTDDVGGGPKMRVMIPAGGRLLYLDQAKKGEPDILLPRAARLRVDSVDGDVAQATLMPYEKPWAVNTVTHYGGGGSYPGGGQGKFQSGTWKNGVWVADKPGGGSGAVKSKGYKPPSYKPPPGYKKGKPKVHPKQGEFHGFHVGDRVAFISDWDSKPHTVVSTEPLMIQPKGSTFKIPVKADKIEALQESVDTELRDAHGEWTRGGSDEFAMGKPGKLTTFMPVHTKPIEQATHDVLARNPSLVDGPKPLLGVGYTSSRTAPPGVTPDAWERLRYDSMGDAQATTIPVTTNGGEWDPGVDLAGEVIVFNDQITFEPTHDAAPSSQTAYGAMAHEMGHALFVSHGLIENDEIIDALDEVGITFDEAKDLSYYAAAAPAEALGEFYSMAHTPGFKLPEPLASKFKKLEDKVGVK